MLGDILDILKGKMVECTGDGNYSIFLKNEINNVDIIEKSKRFFQDIEVNFGSDYFLKMQNYILTFDTNEVKYLYPWMHDDWYFKELAHIYFRRMVYDYYEENIDKMLRVLFFYIFSIFNIEVNSMLKNRMNNMFLTRIGCKQGLCKISRIDINGHIRQDKLIGSVVYEAAHQASGK
jgi:hypothetical protein